MGHAPVVSNVSQYKMPWIVPVALIVVNLFVLFGFPLIAIYAYRRWRKSEKHGVPIGTVLVIGFAASVFFLPFLSFIYRDHLCRESGGWSFATEGDREAMEVADSRPQDVNFSDYQKTFSNNSRFLWNSEIKIHVIHRPTNKTIATRTTYISSLSSGFWFWTNSPESKICANKSYAGKLAYEHFASRISN